MRMALLKRITAEADQTPPQPSRGPEPTRGKKSKSKSAPSFGQNSGTGNVSGTAGDILGVAESSTLNGGKQTFYGGGVGASSGDVSAVGVATRSAAKLARY